MQDISREEFTKLNGSNATSQAIDKDMCPGLMYKINNISPINSTVTNLPKHLDNEKDEVPSFVPVKLEDISLVDLLPSNSSSWQQYPGHELADSRLYLNTHDAYDHNGTNLLLQGSEDPLISHGANNVISHDDEHPADFAKSFITQANHFFQNTISQKGDKEGTDKLAVQQKAPQRLVKSGCSNLTKQQLKAKANLMSARNQQQQQQQHQQQQQQQHQQCQNITAAFSGPTASTSLADLANTRNEKAKNKKGSTVKLRFHHQALPPEYLSHYEATQGQQRISKNQPNLKSPHQRSSSRNTKNFQRPNQTRNSHENVRSWLQKIAEIQRSANASKAQVASQTQRPTAKQSSQTNSKQSSESHNTSKHLATDANNNYKVQRNAVSQNTSTLNYSDVNGGHFSPEIGNQSNFQRSNYADLPFMGEMTLDNCKPRRGRKPKKADICHLIYKNYGTILPKKTKPDNNLSCTATILNRESHCSLKTESFEQPLNLCLRDQINDSYSISSGEDLSETNSTCPTPVSTPTDNVRDSMLANNLKKSLNNITELNEEDKALNTSKQSDEKEIHPMAMCYQKLLESGVLLNSTNGQLRTIKKDNQLALKIPIPSGLFLSHKLENSTSSPVTINLDYPETLSTAASLTTNINSAQNQQSLPPQKRKRSAIFIPPMNVDSSNNPATEVSICKFKFTGGSKPTLQEKKMISVDAGGNYCYFSGTGDKSSRGYEYFPRESLQHTAGLLPGVNCTGQKFCIDPQPPGGHVVSNDLMPSTEPNPSSRNSPSVKPITVTTESQSSNSAITPFDVSKNEACSLTFKENSSYLPSSPTALTTNQCAVKLKKTTSEKERLKKTFKEQGFLIQTQQLESAEGATYCKFRQLKKFTRYLFRNWKDYLPNGIKETTNMTAYKSRIEGSMRAGDCVNSLADSR